MIIAITKEIQKISLYPTQELFKERLEEYIEKGSNGYINDIGRHNWDSRFHVEFMPMVSVISFFSCLYDFFVIFN